MTLDAMQQLLSGELNPVAAVMGGQITIDGDMAVAMKLANIFG